MWLALAALIPAFRGETGKAACFLAADWLLNSQDEKNNQTRIMYNQQQLIYNQQVIAAHQLDQANRDREERRQAEAQANLEESEAMILWALGGIDHIRKFADQKEPLVAAWNDLHGDICVFNQNRCIQSYVRAIKTFWIQSGKPTTQL